MKERILFWEGCNNVRDLGRLRTQDGRVTCWGAVVRSDTPARLTESGWTALHTYGVRTIISLCTFGMVEEALDVTPRYSDIATVRVEIEDITDDEFVQRWVNTSLWGTPLYYKDALRRWPERHAAVIHDRTGIIALLLLALVGVVPDDIIADYDLSPDPVRDEILARERSSSRDAILDVLAGLEVDDYLIRGGASRDDLAAIRERLLG